MSSSTVLRSFCLAISAFSSVIFSSRRAVCSSRTLTMSSRFLLETPFTVSTTVRNVDFSEVTLMVAKQRRSRSGRGRGR